MSSEEPRADICLREHPDDIYLIETVETKRRVSSFDGKNVDVYGESEVLYETEEPKMWWCEHHGPVPLGDEEVDYL